MQFCASRAAFLIELTGVAVEKIMQHLKKRGELMDFEIAHAIGESLPKVRDMLSGLAATNEVIMCYVMRFKGEAKIEGYACRISGYIPPQAPGPKRKG